MESLDKLKLRHADDRFAALMKHVAIDPQTGGPVPAEQGQKEWEFKYVPRIRCEDCVGKMYVTGPGQTVERFQVHITNRKHRERVEARLDGSG